MNTFAYCCASFGRRMARLARTSPTLCPPASAETFDPALLGGHDFVWFKLHGRRGERYWYGDNWTTALSADQIAPADGTVGPDLSGAVVFVSSCWLTDEDGYPSPMLIALARANARAIIGGAGRNWALQNHIGGTDLLGLYVRFFLSLGFSAYHALRFAKWRLGYKRPSHVTEDTRRFTLYRPYKIQRLINQQQGVPA